MIYAEVTVSGREHSISGREHSIIYYQEKDFYETVFKFKTEAYSELASAGFTPVSSHFFYKK